MTDMDKVDAKGLEAANMSMMAVDICGAWLAAAPTLSPIQGEVEPVIIGYARSVDVEPSNRPYKEGVSFWCSKRKTVYYTVPVYAVPQHGSEP